jgi:hypothetical protein
MVLLVLLATMTPPFAQATQVAYAQQDAERLRDLLERASSRSDSLLVRYRLYPLTEDEAVLQGIPSSLSDGTPREYALLSGLWAYRAGEASFFSAVRYGRRSMNLLEDAKAKAPRAPFVLLVEGQSLLFRPSIAGRDPGAAAQRFARLAEVVDEDGTAGISQAEAQVWRCLALEEASQSEKATALRRRMQEQDLPPLYQQFLQSPPDV